MVFNSLNYLLIFLPIIVSIYYFLRNNNYRNLFLIIASFYFYAWGNPLWAMILMLSASIDFLLAQKIEKINIKLEIYNINNQNANSCDNFFLEKENYQKNLIRQKKFYLLISIIFNCLLLLIFKYWNWLMDVASDSTDINFIFLKHHLSLPPAISFYTFESLSYIIDIYRNKYRSTKNFCDYLTFIAFFPKLVAGPIMRAHELIPQLTKIRKKISSKNLEFAIFLILWGLFKKIVFADNFGHLVNLCKKNINNDIGIGYLLGISAIFQIYCDFSAYCDIARGTAKLFAINLRRNFLTPLLSCNTSEFFQRWNITLSNWVRDYIYIPLGGNKGNFFQQNFNLFFTMFLFGVWHGASWYYCFYGLYSALMILIYRLTKIDKILIKFLGNFIGKILAIIIHLNFFVFIMIVIFYSKNHSELMLFLKSFFNIFSANLIIETNNQNISFAKIFYGLSLFALPIIITDILGYLRKREFVDLYQTFPLILKSFLYLLMFYVTLFFYFRGTNDFIYFQF
jgi:D-alanyl-lipoteichoic acid acyltransferase DltB (MBOAT superfamily)